VSQQHAITFGCRQSPPPWFERTAFTTKRDGTACPASAITGKRRGVQTTPTYPDTINSLPGAMRDTPMDLLSMPKRAASNPSSRRTKTWFGLTTCGRPRYRRQGNTAYRYARSRLRLDVRPIRRTRRLTPTPADRSRKSYPVKGLPGLAHRPVRGQCGTCGPPSQPAKPQEGRPPSGAAQPATTVSRETVSALYGEKPKRTRKSEY